jgi:imidazolonepropionase-like amidohydrolase
MLTIYRMPYRVVRGLPAVLAATAVLFAAGAASQARAEEPVVAIKGGTVLTMVGAPVEGGTVLIRNGRIAAVGRNVKIPRGAAVIDARGKFVMPGIVDAMTFFGTRPFMPNVPEPVTPENKIIDAYRPFGEQMRGPGGVQAEPELLCGGVTTIYIAPGSAQLIGGQGAVVKTAGADFDSVILREPASVDMAIAYTPLGAPGAPPSRSSALVSLRKSLAAAQEYRKSREVFAKKPRKEREKAAPPSRDLGKDALALLIGGEIPARIEADLPEDILNALGIAEEFDLALVIDGGVGARKVRDLLAARKVPVVLAPVSHPLDSVRRDDLAEARVLEDARLAAWLTEAGVKVAISSRSADNRGSGKPTQGRWLLLEAALAAGSGLSEENALKAVTINAAEILGVGARVGSLAPGKDADIVILSGPPLKAESLVERVFIDGRLAFSRNPGNGN